MPARRVIAVTVSISWSAACGGSGGASSDTTEALEWHLGGLAAFGKPIRLTEFACGDGADRSLPVGELYVSAPANEACR